MALPPVGCENSPAMSVRMLREAGLRVNRAILTATVRQTSDSAVAPYGVYASVYSIRRMSGKCAEYLGRIKEVFDAFLSDILGIRTEMPGTDTVGGDSLKPFEEGKCAEYLGRTSRGSKQYCTSADSVESLDKRGTQRRFTCAGVSVEQKYGVGLARPDCASTVPYLPPL